ncbi:efflux RND transporter periplasmic adaptor subunit [Massilia sp. CF038]|uniref:efflux RND transporter periplasmic adaptor subunit n=1 Tax=Massilia sp. CF038 TaxID=1881045 RepID=UPI00091C6E9C|nr:efflux RND transporter periplasmic adaptor subunit [Massilia sp. CF038]SHG75474.1 membrane fusion protein, cobalt-zinc-cadmium efflux system [Massilia sp. CF038]
MNKRQTITIGIMLAAALALGASVLVRDRLARAPHAEAPHEAPHEAGHADDQHGPQIIAFTDAQIRSADIALRTAGPARLETFIRMPGEIKFNEDRTAHVTPRVEGIVENVHVNLGQQVRKGTVLAVLASADISEQRSALAAAIKRAQLAHTIYLSEKQLWEDKISARQDYLQAEQAWQEADIAVRNARQKLLAFGADSDASGPFNRLALRAPFDGMIVDKHIAVGEAVGAQTKVFTLSDLKTVWAEVVVPAKDLGIVRVGTEALLHSAATQDQVKGKVSFVSAMIGEQTRSARARVVIENPALAWRPGLFVDVDVVTGTASVPVAVEKEAIQLLDGKQVVYCRVQEGFVARTVVLGRSDGRLVEILSGVPAGAVYAAAHSFTVKAEQGKGAAGHDD